MDMLTVVLVGGMGFTNITETTTFVQAEKSEKVLREAKEASQKSMDKSELDKILAKALEVLGASVQTQSIIIGEIHAGK